MNKDGEKSAELPLGGAAAGERPRVTKIMAEVEIKRHVAEKLFPRLIFSVGEESVTLAEILVPAPPGMPIACVHGASGQKFCVSHYELNGERL